MGSTIRSTGFPTVSIGERELSPQEIVELSIALALDKKAFNPVLIDLKPQGAFTEYFAIVSVNNSRHASAVAEDIRMFFKSKFGLIPVTLDGLETCTWILLDYGAFFVHVFQEATRETYKLENLWSKGKFIEVSEPAMQKLLAEVKQGLLASTPTP